MTFIKNKYLISGVILILFAGILFVTDIFTPYIRPITYIFLMGSSKGKDMDHQKVKIYYFSHY